MDQPAGIALPPADRGLVLRRPDDSYARALWVGLGVSALLHLWFLTVYPSLARVEEMEPAPMPAAAPAAQAEIGRAHV